MAHSLIPETKRLAVERALRETFQLAWYEEIELLFGGVSSALVYRITISGRPYLLRLVMQVDALNDPVRQYACMRIAADAEISPRVHYADPNDAVSITDFVRSVPLREGFPSSDGLLAELAMTVRSIHGAPLFPPLVNYLDGIDGFIQYFRTSELLPAGATEEHFRYYAEIQKAYPRHDTDVVSSHNDLNPRNMLCDGTRIWIIDWETAFRNDRYVDLAIVGNSFLSNEGEEEIYLRTYFGDSLDDRKRARFFLMQQVCHMFYAMAFMRFVATARTSGVQLDTSMETPRRREYAQLIAAEKASLTSPEGQLQYAKVLLNEALANMKTKRFSESIRLMEP